MAFNPFFAMLMALAAVMNFFLVEEIQQKSQPKLLEQSHPVIQKPSMQPLKQQPLKRADPEVIKIQRALAVAKQYKTEGLAKINEVVTTVNQTLSILDTCPASAPGSTQISLFSLYKQISRDAHYHLPMDCNVYSQNAVVAKDNSKIHLDDVKTIFTAVNEMKNFISSTCGSRGLNESEKSLFRNELNSLKTIAQAEAGKFDKFIGDIEKILEEYRNKCI